MNRHNPNKPVVEKRSKEELIRKLKWDKGPEDKMFVYMLMDNENIAAFCSLFIRVENKHMVDQAGGLTTVGRNYRGKNLAKYLKAKMYLKMLEEYPDFEFIRTDTYPWNKHMVDQAGGLTTVGRNYRGKNLAKYLKAKMYLKMLEEYPDFEFIRTDTYPWNRHMYRINEEMGFKPYEKYTEMKFKKSQIEQYLNV